MLSHNWIQYVPQFLLFTYCFFSYILHIIRIQKVAGTAILTVGVSQPSNEKVMSERFAARNASVTSGAEFLPLFFFHNKRPEQQNERKYIGIILQVNGMDYFAPLSSYKPKHARRACRNYNK